MANGTLCIRSRLFVLCTEPVLYRITELNNGFGAGKCGSSGGDQNHYSAGKNQPEQSTLFTGHESSAEDCWPASSEAMYENKMKCMLIIFFQWFQKQSINCIDIIVSVER